MSNPRDVAIYFLNLSNQEKSRTNIIRAVKSAGTLLESYSSSQVKDVIEYLIDVKKIDLYSLAYLNNHMDKYLEEIENIRLKETYAEHIKNIQTQPTQEVSVDEQSVERNNGKLHRFGIQSRVREKFNFDLFEE
jgi:hypothetical protein